jgi:NodT family efflux transporter outer membrane factor (OMF) lipoprotein
MKMLNQDTQLQTGSCILRVATAFALTVLISGCTTLAPEYQQPDTEVEPEWMEADSPAFKAEEPRDDGRWWTVFGDPVLDRLIESAYRQNLTLKTAGLRILQARAQLGIAVGRLYPQQQQATANSTYIRSSRNTANTAGGDLNFWNHDVGLTAGWEIDFWGRYASGIASSDASLLSTVANYDDVLVSLTAQVATTYIAIRSFEQRMAIAKQNIVYQERGFQLAKVRYRNGATTELDVNQAESLLRGTQSTLPSFELARRQAMNALATLLGIMPVEVNALIYGPGGTLSLDGNPSTTENVIPSAPAEVAVGIPADLLRRRPDVRTAELQAMAQGANIGVAMADLYPSIALFGTIGLSTGSGPDTSRNGSVDLGDLLNYDALRFQGGPSLTWNVFNYGRIKNNVRVQDALLQQLLISYQNTVLQAGQEVEDAMVGFLQSQQQAEFLRQGAAAAQRSVKIALVQYRDGATDYTTVLNTQQSLLGQQDQLTATRGSIVQNLVSMYRALGGGWQIREGQDFVSEETRAVMRERTDWGGLLDPEALENIPPPEEAARELRRPDW